MENQIQLSSSQYLSTPLNEKEIEIAKVIYHTNQLSPFPVTDQKLEEWAKSINELKPGLHIEKLKEAVDKMKLGKCEYDSRLGIQNIFTALDSLERPMVY